jgi:xanthine dehydrogenase large subunit
LHDRLIKVASHRLDLPEAELSLSDGFLHTGDKPIMSFKELVNEAYLQRVSLFATGFYRTPDINFDPDSFTGSPFYYYANGAAVSEVEVDLLTGEHKVNQVDILHEVGQSLNEEIDKGQIEGGFIQGMGWLTMEELVWNDQGVLQTHSPSTYKIPTCRERPSIVNIDLLRDAPNQVESIYRSKAVGEPPLMLSISVLHALSDAISSIANYRFCPQLNVPATPEHILESVQRVEKLGLASV